MTVTHGNDPDVLDGIADALRAQADRVETISGTGASGVAVLVDAWAGPDLEVFGEDWRGAQQQLESAAQLLRAVGERAREQAQQQRDSSGEGGAAGPGARGPAASPARHVPPPSPGDRVPHSDSDQSQLPIPIPDDGKPWTPQGLGYSEEQDVYVHSLYNHDNGQEGVLAIQPADGGPVQYVHLEGNDHYGGVTVDGDNVYVTGNGRVTGYDDEGEPITEGPHVEHYSLEDLRAAGEDEVVEPISRHSLPTASTVTSHDGTLYVGDYNDGEPGKIYEFDLGDGGGLPAEGADWDPTNEWVAPNNIQGVVTDGENFYVTQSHGADDPSTLIRIDRGSNEFHEEGDLSPLSQGLVIRDGELVITSESGSAPYRQEVIDSDSPWKPNFIEQPVDPEDDLQTHDLPS
ncbi:hypothetical protein [Janibacter anophelis]|uniref:hypothetical protein n=1 Tax=Janibacter anophelis TaxID=319054 RepID=UPI000833EC44|nr:hypothetical protein [Janibacter anophelis]